MTHSRALNHAAVSVATAAQTGQRLDKWLWFARLFRSRSEAADMCQSRHLRLDGRVIDKCHATVRPGSVISFPKAGHVVVVRVRDTAEARGPFSVARQLYDDLSPTMVYQPPRMAAPEGEFPLLMTVAAPDQAPAMA